MGATILGHTLFKDIFGDPPWCWEDAVALWEVGGVGPEMSLSNYIMHPIQTPTTKNYPVQNVNSAETEKILISAFVLKCKPSESSKGEIPVLEKETKIFRAEAETQS